MNSIGQQKAAVSWGWPLLLCLCFLLPALLPPLFLWLNPLLAVPVFLLFQTAGSGRQAAARLRNGLLPAAAAALLMDRAVLLLFSLVMLPLGWSLHRSARQGIPPAAAGWNGVLVLSLSWLAFWAVYGLSEGVNPYTGLLKALEDGLDQAVAAFRSSPDLNLSADALYHFELLAAWLRETLPRVLPGLLAGMLLLTVWLNMLAGSYLLRRMRPDQAAAWPSYRQWQLPDSLIWLLIAAASLALAADGPLQDAGCCLIIVMALLYFFQGLAVFVCLLHRWNVPLFWRILLYLTVTAQSYGVLLLAVTGVADTWADFRKLTRPADGS